MLEHCVFSVCGGGGGGGERLVEYPGFSCLWHFVDLYVMFKSLYAVKKKEKKKKKGKTKQNKQVPVSVR